MAELTGIDALAASFRTELGPPVEELIALTADPQNMTVKDLLRSVQILRGKLAQRTEERNSIHATADGLQEQLNDAEHRTNRLVQLIDEVAIYSLAYAEKKYGHDDQARLNVQAGTTEALCYGLPNEVAAKVRAAREHGPAPVVLDDAEAVDL